MSDSEPILRYLLSKWANPNAIDEYGHTVLGMTTNEASLNILVQNGADLSREKLLHRALGFSEDRDWKKHMEFLVDVLGVDINAPAVFGGEGHISPDSRWYPRWLEQKGHAGTALHWAVRGFQTSRDLDMKPKVKWLLEKGADPNVLDDEGLTPVECARDQEMRDIFEIHAKSGVKESEGVNVLEG